MCVCWGFFASIFLSLWPSVHVPLQVSQLVDWDQLLHCIKTSRWDYELRAEYFKLLNTLYLEHEVSTRLMMRGEFVFAVQNTAVTATEAKESKRRSGRLSLQPLKGISHDLTATFAGCQRLLGHEERLDKLKGVGLNSLELALKERTFHCRMLMSSSDKGHLLMPLLTALDSFLVLGYFRNIKDRKRLLAILHPSLSDKKGRYYVIHFAVRNHEILLPQYFCSLVSI